MSDLKNKDDKYWQAKLTREQYHILRKKGTERAFSGEYDQHFEQGKYKCAACGFELFLSDAKYDAGCGWPSFYEQVGNNVETAEDNSFGMRRLEIKCSNCGGHLGHVFDDGPRDKTGKRYCVNSASLDFEPRNKPS